MRTTVNINPELLTEAKVLAARRGQPLGAVVDDALRVMLNEGGNPSRSIPRVVLQTDGGSGLHPGVDLEDKDSLADLLGDNGPGAAG